jgi:hypothetical protein
MTFTEVSAKYHDPVSTLGQSIHNKFRMHHSRAHNSNNPHIMWILHPGSTCEISGGVGAPVAAKSNYFRLKTHVIYSFLKIFISKIPSQPSMENVLIGRRGFDFYSR